MSNGDLVSIRPFLANLAGLVRVPEDELNALAHLIKSLYRHQLHQHILTAGDKAPQVHVVISGIACRYRQLPNGRRQITAFLIPGDICDYRFLSSSPIDQDVLALSATSVAHIGVEDLVELGEQFPAIMRALLRASAVDATIAREWLISLGQRNAIQRMAYLFCELMVRMRRIGMVRQQGFAFPATQSDLGDALGLSAVHVNRTIQELRRTELVSMAKGVVTLHDFDGLAKLGLFDSALLGYGSRT